MKSKYSSLLVSLLTIGIIGAYGSNATATIENSINDIQEISIGDGIAAQRAIARTIWASDINRIAIPKSEIALIGIANIIDANQIDAARIKIAA